MKARIATISGFMASAGSGMQHLALQCEGAFGAEVQAQRFFWHDANTGDIYRYLWQEGDPDDLIRIAAGHSFGIGFGLDRTGKRAFQEGRQIDLAICIDQVPYFADPCLRPVLDFGDGPERYLMTRGVKAYISMRTVNYRPPLLPFGRDIDANGVECWGAWAWGSESNLARYNPILLAPGGATINADIKHDTIDESEEVHEIALGEIQRMITGAAA